MNRRARHWANEWRLLTKGIATELTLMIAAVVALAGATVGTLMVSFRDESNLNFAGTRSLVTSAVGASGAELIAVQRTALINTASLRQYDSLAIVGDTTQTPSLAKGGFLRDQVESFNTFAYRKALTGELAGDLSVRHQSPSLLQLARTDDGAYVLNARLNPSALSVSAPSTARRSITLRTADWGSGSGLIGMTGELAFAGETGMLSTPVALSHANCAIKPVLGEKQLLYCNLAAGYKVNRGYDFQVASAKLAKNGKASLSQERREQTWLNGTKATTPLDVGVGDLIYTRPMGPSSFSRLDRGVLSGEQWVNGRVSLHSVRDGSLRFWGRAANSIDWQSSRQTVTLTLDEELTNELDAQVKKFVQTYGKFIETMSVLVADVATGELKAIAEPMHVGEEPLLAFEPVLVGSMSKPLIAAAIVSRQPELAYMAIPRNAGMVTSVGGLSLAKAMGNPGNNCPAVITFVTFLQCSSNQYAAELVTRSLQRTAGRQNIVRRGAVPNDVLQASALTDGLLTLYGDVDVVKGRTPGRSKSLWQHDSVGANADAVPRDEGMYPWVSRPWFIAPDADGTSLDLLARFAIGGWENRWTLVGALEAYMRVATNQRVHLTVAQRGKPLPAAPKTLPAGTELAFQKVREGLRAVAQVGTAYGLDRVMASISPTPASIVVLAKTGTLNEKSDSDDEDGVFLKSLAVVAGVPQSEAPGSPLRCGLASIVYIQFRQDWKTRARLGEGASLPLLHLQFADSSLAPALRQYWKRSSTCSPNAKKP